MKVIHSHIGGKNRGLSNPEYTERVKDLQDEAELPYKHEPKEYEMKHHTPNYSPAKPMKKTVIVKQKKREFLKK